MLSKGQNTLNQAQQQARHFQPILNKIKNTISELDQLCDYFEHPDILDLSRKVKGYIIGKKTTEKQATNKM